MTTINYHLFRVNRLSLNGYSNVEVTGILSNKNSQSLRKSRKLNKGKKKKQIISSSSKRLKIGH